MRRTFAILMVLFTGLPAAALASFTPGPRLDLSTGTATNGFCAVDLNRDGLTDFVTANNNAGTVSVLLALGGGRFAAKTDYVAGGGTWAIAVGDVNGDGFADAATANLSGNSCTVLLGDGLGRFPSVTSWSVPGGPAGVGIADLEHDGFADIVVANSTTSSYSVFRGGPFGVSGLRSDYACGTEPGSLALGDVNADGHPDLVLARFNGAALELRLGAGDRTFGAGTTIAVGLGPNHVFMADLNGDRRPDLVSTDYYDGALSVLFNVNGTFPFRTVVPCGNAPAGAAAGDVDGDGLPDLVSANTSGSNVSVMIGNGGGFGAKTNFTTSANNRFAGVADVDGDGWDDVVAASVGANALVALPALASARLGTPYALLSLPSPGYLATGDLNADGRPDLVVAGGNSGGFTALLSNGTKAFGARTGGSGMTTALGIGVGDLNSDGIADVAVAGIGTPSYSLGLYPGIGDGTFGARSSSVLAAGATTIAIGEVNNAVEPRMDVVVSNNSTVSVLEGVSSGLSTKTDYSCNSTPSAPAIGDVNGDGLPDVAVANMLASGTVSILYGTGFSFVPPVSLSTCSVPIGVVLFDANGDGKLDIVTASNTSAAISVHLGTGAGNFAPRVDYATGGTCWCLTSGDYNGDGRTDVAVGLQSAGFISVLLGDGAGRFSVRHDVSVGRAVVALASADFDGDGVTDLAATGVQGGANGPVYSLLSRRRVAVTAVATPAALPLGYSTRVDVTVAPRAGADTPTGTVRLYEGLTLVGTGTLANGRASVYLSVNTNGEHALTAHYTGDGDFLGARSAPLTLRTITSYAPVISSIADVRNDQGRAARLVFAASGLDYLGSATPITQYVVYRKIAAGLAARPADDVDAPGSAGGATTALLAGWDYVTAVPATMDGPYDVVVPTLADSNASGPHRATFLVRALTASATYHDSAPDSGYTVDNLPPAPPSGFAGTFAISGTSLRWNGGFEGDLWYYRLYRGATPSFTPDAASWLANTTNTSYTDAAGSPFFYKLSAVDQNGNESGFVSLQPAGTAGVEGTSLAFALEPPSPNPVRGARLAVSFALAGAGPATLELLDVSGRRVAAREVGASGAGRHTAELTAPGRLAPGLYLVRLAQGGRTLTRRVSVIE
ncbi:MAG: VCBS repeat-containing protein [Candidatus Eisenbacteria bacterium]|uniref:VCBS repeat-containing protein n=1 Tax=Eiseniibacteriota bacterium TaxID=2212470 RepID=A0A933W2W2_UNCEI|nr:VCBS repeat-containing protein [Candidatus Eisenbacteria bacterium]